MKHSGNQPTARKYLDGLASRGRHHFTSAEAQSALGVSANAAKLALYRLTRQGFLASPARGFYVIVPPEYRSLGCLPAEQFIDALMERLGLAYYVSLLSAAELHGAAHQRPQALQVFLEASRRPLACGRARVIFMVRKRLRQVPVQRINTPRGTLAISTPEATALDLVGYAQRAGGLNLIATILSELAEKIDPQRLAAAAADAPIAWAQRLGYLLEHVGASGQARSLKDHVRAHAQKATPLLPGAPRKQAKRNDDWKVDINTEVEIDL